MRRSACDNDIHAGSAALSPATGTAMPDSGRSCRLVIQNTKPIRRKNASTVTDTTWVAKPRVGVNASAEVSRMTPYTCQCWRSPERT